MHKFGLLASYVQHITKTAKLIEANRLVVRVAGRMIYEDELETTT